MTPKLSRRSWIRNSALAGAGSAALGGSALRSAQAAAPAVVGSPDLTVKKIEQIFVDVPFKPVPKRHQYREFAHEGRRFNTIVKVHLGNGVVGVGEGGVRGNALQRVTGANAAEHMWDDSMGSGLQVALFDAVARTNDVPVHRLLGNQVRERAFMSWWAVDMPAADWALECKEAVSKGYTSFKGKARPWFDLIDQCKGLSATLPEHFEIDFDFNSMLLDSGHASTYLAELEQFHNIAIFETPIPQDDVEGNKLLRTKTNIPIAQHYGNPPIMTALREEVCDGFVIGGGAKRVIESGTIAAMANKAFWLQLTGNGLTAVWAMHLAAVLTHAQWPAINLNHMFVSDLVKPGIVVENGTAQIPNTPGLGYDLDEDAVAKYRIQEFPKRPQPNKLYAIRWPSGAASYYRNADEFRSDFMAGKLPVFPRGVYMEEVPDNGSKDWKDMNARAQNGGVHLGTRPL
jgi:L-alanine-DL-glutamate epimerase-like enolase superfamily enzyme